MSAGLPTELYDAPEAAVSLRSEDLAAISGDVWSCFVGGEVHPVFATSAAEEHEPTMLASVGITGAWGGHVLIELPVPAAQRAARAMLGLDEVSDREVVDAIGELSNMVGGNVKSLVPGPSHLGLPIVVQGNVAPSRGSDTVEVCRVDLGWDDTTFRVSVWARTNHGTETAS